MLNTLQQLQREQIGRPGDDRLQHFILLLVQVTLIVSYICYMLNKIRISCISGYVIDWTNLIIMKNILPQAENGIRLSTA